MSLDFTFTKYEQLCSSIVNLGYPVYSVEKYLTMDNKPSKYVILRHDVDIRPDHSLKIAQIENEYGISSTYYFRITEEVFRPDLIKGIAKLGHEIGYHYEVLDKARGDAEKAIRIFQQELQELRKIADIKTICMHGNSRTKWDNRDLWKTYDFKDFDIIGEAYLSINFDNIAYFSDTARTWNPKYKIKDTANSDNNQIINRTDDLIKIISENKTPELYILVHPDDWYRISVGWITNLISRKFKNIGKVFLKVCWNKTS